MSTTSTTSSTGTSSTSTTGYLLDSLGSGSAEQVTGLASGLDTDAIVKEEMALYEQPVTNLQNQVTGLNATNTALTKIQTELQTLAADAQALGDPSLFNTSQAVTSSNPTAVSATSSSGAGIGGYEVSVAQLANSAQSTYSYSDLSTAGTITIATEAGSQQVTIPSGESVTDFVNSINSNSGMGVYAAATSSGSVIFSDRQTGSQGQITVKNGGGTQLQPSSSTPGQDALYTIGSGAQQSSSSNSVANAIPGVTLTFNALTGSAPATINVAPPAASASNIESAINTFVTQYNTVISDIQTQLSTAPSSSDPTVGTLYDDPELSNLLSSMRSSIYTSGSGLPVGMANLEDLGISTGAATSGAVSQSALSGNLTLNADTLTSALQSNPAGVQKVLRSWSLSFSFSVNDEAAPGGTIDQRIQGDDSQVTDLQSQISSMQEQLNQRQTDLVNQFAAMEAALSQNQSQASWLTSQINSLPGA